MFVHLEEEPFSKNLPQAVPMDCDVGVILPECLFIRELLELCWAVVVLVGIMLPCLVHWAALSPPIKQHLCTSFAVQEQDLPFLDKYAASGDN